MSVNRWCKANHPDELLLYSYSCEAEEHGGKRIKMYEEKLFLKGVLSKTNKLSDNRKGKSMTKKPQNNKTTH